VGTSTLGVNELVPLYKAIADLADDGQPTADADVNRSRMRNCRINSHQAFKQLGIFKLSPENLDAGDEAIRRVRAEMYCEEIQFW
jgi:hypothetical protein